LPLSGLLEIGGFGGLPVGDIWHTTASESIDIASQQICEEMSTCAVPYGRHVTSVVATGPMSHMAQHFVQECSDA